MFPKYCAAMTMLNFPLQCHNLARSVQLFMAYEEVTAPSQDASKMNAKCHFVKIDCLEAKISQKLPVDIVGVVTDVGTLGSIKRKQDDTEFVRRFDAATHVCVLL